MTGLGRRGALTQQTTLTPNRHHRPEGTRYPARCDRRGEHAALSEEVFVPSPAAAGEVAR